MSEMIRKATGTSGNKAFFGFGQLFVMKAWLKDALGWFFVLGAGLLLLIGRYDWAADIEHARIGFFCSAFYFLIITPVLYYLIVELTTLPRAAFVITGIWWVTAVVPYRWLHLDRFYYDLENILWVANPSDYTKDFVTRPDWFPQAFQNLPAIPYEGPIFLVLLLLGAGLTVFLYRRYEARKKFVILAFTSYAVILLQTWMHLSLRSPYLYYTRWVPSFDNHFFRLFMFPDGKGAVNNDVHVFRSLELLFMGKPYPWDLLFRRSVYFYISSQFSYFFNLYYVSLILNVVLWAAAVVCGYLFTRMYWPERVALLTAGFIATGSGFIMFVAQPMVYLFERIVIAGPLTVKKLALFGAFLGLASLNYDIFPFYLYIIGYGLFRKVNWMKLIGMIAIAVMIYGGLLLVYQQGLGKEIQTSNSELMTGTLNGFLQWAASATPDQWHIKFKEFFAQFFNNMGSGFIVLPAVFALLGLPLLDGSTRKGIIFFLFLPAVAMQAVLQFGGARFSFFYLYELPRLYYIVFPGMYILAAVFLDGAAKMLSGGMLKRLAPTFPWAGLALVVFINNIDVWGVPSLYYHLYFSVTGSMFLK
jgi:hypothetical protein